ncbi:MAG: N-methyl-L-tryptophan oxidase, partial [Planctomycetota bacterium]
AIDRFSPPHDQGSSHGESRIIRRAYFEHPDYVPLTFESYRQWAELEAELGRQLLVETGLVQAGPVDGHVLRGLLAAAERHQLPIELLTAAEAAARWPTLKVPPEAAAVFEQSAGYLLVEHCVAALLEAAKRSGAELLGDTHVVDWQAGNVLQVQTTNGVFLADRLILATGAWSSQWLAALDVELQVLRKVLLWYGCDDPRVRVEAGMPAYLFELPQGVFYGFPRIGARGLKVAEHSGGDPTEQPSRLDRRLRETDRKPIDEFLNQCVAAEIGELLEHSVCMYTMTRDQHFIIDRWPGDPRVTLAAGLSGHGFKFAPALGQAVVDLAIDGATDLPIKFLALDRFEG